MVIGDIIGAMYSAPLRTFGFDIGKNDLTHKLPALGYAKGEVKAAPGGQPTQGQIRKQRILSPPTNTTPAASKLLGIKPGNVPSIKPVALTAKPKKLKATRPKIYAKKRGQDGF
jgi:hypothetical protein